MDKIETDAKDVINQLGDFSSLLATSGADINLDDFLHIPMMIMQKTMKFDVSVFYKITNIVENRLLLKIIRVKDKDGYRSDLREGRKFQLDLDNPDPIYINETLAYRTHKVSCINVPKQGCDIVGYVYLPESMGAGYLFGGDFCGHESAVRDYEASVIEIICNFISTLLLKREFEKLAVVDTLTSLYNSRRIKEIVQTVCARFERLPGRQSSIVLCDIDHFKRVNDTYGHIQGDIILRDLGRLLRHSMREHFDHAGRYGGEEFLLVFEDTPEETAIDIVERLRKTVEQHSFPRIDKSGSPIEGSFMTITLSFGIACYGGTSEPCDAVQWIARADKALYQSKADGRNRTTLWREDL